MKTMVLQRTLSTLFLVLMAGGAHAQTRAECLQSANQTLSDGLDQASANYTNCEIRAESNQYACQWSAESTYQSCSSSCYDYDCEVIFDVDGSSSLLQCQDPCGCGSQQATNLQICDAQGQADHAQCRQTQAQQEQFAWNRYHTQIDNCPAE